MFSKKIKIPYSSLTNIYPADSLFLDYISSFDRVKPFFDQDYRSLDKISESIKECQIPLSQRKKLYNILIHYNKENNNSPKVMDNLNTFLDEDCYTIITGQQCGLLTGPLYTIYKAMTAILLSEKLNQEGTHKFIPLFWVASEDHDLTEINQITYPNIKGDLETLSLNIENHGFSIRDITLEDQFDQLLDDLKEKWVSTDFSEEIFSLLEKEKKSLSGSFVHLISILFKKYGLIIVEPYLLREMSAPLNKIALEKDIEIHKAVNDSATKLTQLGYTPSLYWDDAINLFYYHNNKRSKLYWSENDDQYKTRDGELTISHGELTNKIIDEPYLFSHNVILRPIVQDILFPNAVSVLGPGEISYHAQLKGVYRLFERKMPVIYPRTSVTLFEKKYQKLQNKFQFTVEEILNHQLDRKSQIFFKQFENEQAVTKFISNIEQEITELMLDAEKQGKNVLDSLKPSVRKVNFEIHKIRDKYLKKLEENLGLSKHHIEKLQNGITPRLKPQERVFNLFYFMNYYGLDFVSEVMNQIDITDFSHNVLFY